MTTALTFVMFSFSPRGVMSLLGVRLSSNTETVRSSNNNQSGMPESSIHSQPVHIGQ